MTLGQAYSRSMTSTVVVVGREAEQVAHPRVVGQPAAVHHLDDVVGHRRAEHAADHGRDPPVGPDQRDRQPPSAPGALQRGDPAVGDDVHRLIESIPGGDDEGPGGVGVLDDGERRVGQHAERDRRLAQQAAERARDVRAEHGARADGADGDADAGADRVRRALDVGQLAAVPAGRVDGGVLVGAGGRAAGPAVDLDPAAHDHRLEGAALGRGAEDRRRRLVGESRGDGGAARLNGSHTAMWTTTCGLNAVTVSTMRSCSLGRDAVEHGPVETAAGRIGVDAHELTDPRLGLEQHGDA